MSENSFSDCFSPKELEAFLTVPKHQSHHEPHSKSDSDFQEPLSMPQEYSSPQRTNLRAKRAKRGDSLEREIAKFILSEAHRNRHTNVEMHPVGVLSPREILSDLIASQNNTSDVQSQILATEVNFSIERNSSGAAHFDNSTVVGHFAEFNLDSLPPCNSDAFDFNANDNEWAIFEDCSIFGIEHKPTKKLDDDGFPLSRTEETNEEKDFTKNFDMELNPEATAGASVDSYKAKDTDEKSERVEIMETTLLEEASVISSDDKSVRSESKTGLLSLPGGSIKGNSHEIESKQSPSSVATFPFNRRLMNHMTGGRYAFKDQSSTVSRSSWSPKPPEHYRRLFRPGDTLS